MSYTEQVYYGQTLNNLMAVKTFGNLTGGSFSTGTSAAWFTGTASGSVITFTSSTLNTNVSNLSGVMPLHSTAPTLVTTDGSAAVTETAAVTFHSMASGQALSMEGLTFTAGANGATANQIASAFASVNSGTTAASINATKTLGDAAGGTFTAGTSAAWTTATTTNANLVFTSTTATTNVTNLTGVQDPGNSAPVIVEINGSAIPAVTETAAVTFHSMASGQALSMEGLTFTAGANGATANQIASAFASVNSGTTAASINATKTLGDAAGGTFTAGTSAAWNSGAAAGAAVTFTSTTASTDVTNLTSAVVMDASAPLITETEGSAANTETAAVTFNSMVAGDSVTFAGLTYTAGVYGASSAQVANAFSNLAVGTTADVANHGPMTMASAYVVTPGALTTTTSLAGYFTSPVDGNIYNFQATGSFATTTATSTIAGVKGSITSLKLFLNGSLVDSINYGASVDDSMFGVTDVTPITPAVITAQRAQAGTEFNNGLILLNSGATFIGSNASNGGSDQIQGGSGNDIFTGNGGNDYFDGKGGINTSVYRGLSGNYTITTTTTTDRTDPSGLNQVIAMQVNDSVAGRDGVDTLVNVQRLQFSDIKLAFDLTTTQSAGEAILLLGTVLPATLAFDTSKQSLIGAVIGLFDQGYTMQQLAGALLRLPIWDAITGVVNAGNADVANYLLNNVSGNTIGLGAAVAAMNAESSATQGTYLATLATGGSGQTHVGLVGLQAHGLAYL